MEVKNFETLFLGELKSKEIQFLGPCGSKETLFPGPCGSIIKLERHRDLITKRIISGTITRMKRFDMYGKVKPKKLKIVEFAVVDDDRLYRFGGFSDSD